MVGVLPRSDAHGAAEGTLQMLRAQSRGLSEAAKVGGSLRFCLDCLAHLPDRFHLRVDRCLLGVAAPARSVPRSILPTVSTIAKPPPRTLSDSCGQTRVLRPRRLHLDNAP